MQGTTVSQVVALIIWSVSWWIKFVAILTISLDCEVYFNSENPENQLCLPLLAFEKMAHVMSMGEKIAVGSPGVCIHILKTF